MRSRAPKVWGHRPLTLPCLGVVPPPVPPSFGARYARPAHVPRARGLRPRLWGCAPTPLGFVASRASRACAPCVHPSVLLALPPSARSLPPAPHPRGVPTPVRFFCKTKSPTFSGKAFANTLSVKILYSA